MSDKSGLVKPLLMAAVAGLIIGGIGVYVTHGGAVHEVARCDEAKSLSATLSAFRKGDLAGLLPADNPADLSDIRYTDVAGKSFSLTDEKDKVLLLNLWATWCIPCRAEMPALERLQKVRGGKDFQVVTVNIDTGDPAKPTKFLSEIGVTALPDYRDPKMAVFNQLKLKSLAFGLPTSLIVDRKTCQMAMLSGPAEWDSPQALNLIDAVIAMK